MHISEQTLSHTLTLPPRPADIVTTPARGLRSVVWSWIVLLAIIQLVCYILILMVENILVEREGERVCERARERAREWERAREREREKEWAR